MLPSKQLRLSFELNPEELNTENDGNELQPPEDQIIIVDDENVLIPPTNQELPGGEIHDMNNIQLVAEPDNVAGRDENEASQDLPNYVANSAEGVFYLEIVPNEFRNGASISRVMSPSEQLRFELNSEELNTENDGNELQPPEYQMVDDENVLIPPMSQELPGAENHDANNVQLAAEPDNVAGRDENYAYQDLSNYVANSAEGVFYLAMVPEESKNDAVVPNELRAKKRPNEDNLDKPNLTELEKELAKPAPKKQSSRPESPKVQEAEMPSINELNNAPGSSGDLLVPRNENENIWLFPNMPILSPYDSDSSDSCSCNSSIVSNTSEEDLAPIYIFSSELARVIQAADSTEERVVQINNIPDSIPSDDCESFWAFETVQESDISSTSPDD